MLHTFLLFCLFCLCWMSLMGVFGAETNGIQSVSLTEGDCVTLNTDVTEIHEDNDVLWNFEANNSMIAQIKKKKQIFSTYDDGPNETFKDRLKLDKQTASLTITNITTEHAGLYKLQISGAKLLSKTFSVSIYARLPAPVISSNSSQCSSSQQNCSLLCSVVNVSHVNLSWYKGNSLLSSISVSDLSISLSLPLEVEYQEKNSYSCVINNPITNQTTHLDISKLCQPCSVLDPHFLSQDSLLKMLISVAAGSLLIVAAVWIFWIYRKCRKTEQEVFDDVTVQNHDEELIYADPTFYKRKHMN
ncbi:SLAM family member 9 isoform X1 [Carassius gibelio]|uniref:SLAM family member 9 isoform X1 n=1 Tax=Carassius gibelio TaxID=101364 RepID=UPI002278E694|nr:SLAM family member 9 isoform X1 [Carassius gibelio]